MAVFRSLLFLLILLLVTPPYTLGVILCRPLPHHMRRQTVVPWVNFTIWLVKHVLGIPYRLLGAENIPDRAAIVLAKHQSAWETFMLQEVFKDTVFVWRKEIKYLPFFGWALASIPMIETDRSATKSSLKRLVEQGRDRLANGYTVIIFPEGTRSQPGSKNRYKGGGALLAVETGAPVVPVALNSGEFWGRNALFKRCGTVTVSIGPTIDPAGLTASEVLDRAEAWIETEMSRISPHLYGGPQ
ncbi:MAG: acyl-phosphate glycerol 3-phosphate acyltransferase [Rhodocyclales bacterium RIFCSPLOWO2_02_FULL_63_24]|nr:MAG: acyl-phosphate glycerol 3-phosphate acyltransferase [Rhodocyclales bacterium GWA2_65_19]OHC68432.1 MAG: acyl-phosphate glycerol 3-phosphate acyltransferase [Rhodocyclales bacterium RIFCSPLOWO2_02_FULL_63_24]